MKKFNWGREVSKRRRQVQIALLVIALVLALFGGLITRQFLVNEAGIAAYQQGKNDVAISQFHSLSPWGFFEKWLPAFNEGTARVKNQDALTGVTWLEKALKLAPAKHECDVRRNLSTAYEVLGDEAAATKKFSEAAAFYQSATDAMRTHCQQNSQDQQRQQDKKNAAAAGNPPPAGSNPGGGSSSPSKDPGSGGSPSPSNGPDGGATSSPNPSSGEEPGSGGSPSPSNGPDGGATSSPNPSSGKDPGSRNEGVAPKDPEHKGILGKLNERNKNSQQGRGDRHNRAGNW